MDVILIEKIRSLGELGDRVQVKPGYARNYLIPQGKAVSATKGNLEKFNAQRAAYEQRSQEILTASQARAEELSKLNITIPATVSEEGKLYGSIGVRDIVDAVVALGVQLQKNEVRLTEGVLRYIGEYNVELHLPSDIVVNIKINIVPEN
jgi:large subunit ribosomal protein L9